MKPRRRARPLALVLVAVLLLGAAACGDDDGDDATDDTTTTEAASGDDASGDADEPDDTSATTDDPTGEADATEPDDTGDTDDEATTTTADPDVTTTSPNLTPNDSSLADLLLAPSELGEGFAPDDTLGDGSFDGDLCEEVTVDPTFDDQAAQALLQGTGEDAVSFNQSVMRFSDDQAAQAFVDDVVEGIEQCTPGAEVVELDAGDATVLLSDADDDFAVSGGLVRVGDLVSWTLSLTASLDDSPNTEALLATVADRLTA